MHTSLYYSRAQAAVELDKSVATVDRLRRAGLLQAYRRDGEVLILREDVSRLKQEAESVTLIEASQ